MNSLLKRQIRKYLSEEFKDQEGLKDFINAIDRSYDNFDEQSAMIQRAMSISSNELFRVNRQLQAEAKEQYELIEKLKNVINTLKPHNLENREQEGDLEISGSKLVDFIDSQAREIVEVNKKNETLLKELAHQNQELSDYAHMVSHDLKSPLRSIDTLVTWIRQDYFSKLDDSGKENLDLIRDNVEKMDTLISGILQYSTINKEQVEFYDVDLNNLIDEILSSIQVPEHIDILVTSLPTIKGDKYRLKQLFQNIIDNAVKYNDKKKGIVKVYAKDKNTHWEFAVSDNGKGIEEQYFNKIFKTFSKLENSPNSTGIGLSIVKKIVELYGGEIWLSSEKGLGTTFHFTLKKELDGTT